MPGITKQRNNKRTRQACARARRRWYEQRQTLNSHRRVAAQVLPNTDAAIGTILVQRMTNWQLTQWNRAGSPQDLQSVRHFALMER